MFKNKSLSFGKIGQAMITKTITVGSFINQVHYSSVNHDSKEFVIFYPGDVQLSKLEFQRNLGSDYPFQNNNDIVEEVYYEKVLDLLHTKYPNANSYVIIQPSKLNTESLIYEFDNFYIKGNSIRLLLHILKDLFPNQTFGEPTENSPYLHLLAFSKGCVVLNSQINEYINFKRNINNKHNLFENFTWWDEKPQTVIHSCYHLKAVNPTKEVQQIIIDEMNQCINLFENNVSSIHFLDVHRFIYNKEILTGFITYLNERQENLFIKIHQTPLVKEQNIFRRHVKVESEVFLKTIQKQTNNVYYQYYYKELEKKRF
ncbi:hypothetical protein ABK040_004488 [Willaertia magna]